MRHQPPRQPVFSGHFRIPPGFEIVRIEAGKAAKAAAKTLVCNRAKCIVYGLNRTTIPNGPIAMLKIGQSLVKRDRSAPLEYPALGRARTKKPQIWIDDPIAASLKGKVIPVAPGTAGAAEEGTHESEVKHGPSQTGACR